MKIKTYIIIGIILLFCSSAIGVAYYQCSLKDVYTHETDFIYEYGIKLQKDYDVVRDEVFIDIPIGIAVWSSYTLIENCTFINCNDEGIVFLGGSSYNIVRNCVFYDCVDGIEIQSSTNNTFINCIFINNTHAGFDAIHEKNDNNTFIDCVFYNNCMGTYFSDGENTSYIDCVFENNNYNRCFHQNGFYVKE